MAQESWKLDQEEAGCQPPEGAIHCANNCGFFGSKSTRNMCSKCYRDLVLAEAKASPVKAVSEKAFAATTIPQPLGESSRQADSYSKFQQHVDVDASSSNSDVETRNSAEGVAIATRSRLINRCFSCRKRVGLTAFKCRCGDIFCSLHRHSEKHNCSYDYKAAGRDAISKANPVVKADKVGKI